jgi:hypothetical protein
MTASLVQGFCNFLGDAFLALEASCFFLGVNFFGTWTSKGIGASNWRSGGASKASQPPSKSKSPEQ